MERNDMSMKTGSVANNLSSGFMRSVGQFPDSYALDVNDVAFTYKQLSLMAGELQRVIKSVEINQGKLVALFAYRSYQAYAGALGILGSGFGYVPLHPEFPVERNLSVLKLSLTNLLIVGKECQSAFNSLLEKIDKKMDFILVGFDEADDYAAKYPLHEFFIVESILEGIHGLEIDPVKEDDLAYLLFTSGSTGEPKGVPVMHLNARSFVEFQSKRYDFNEHDRFSQLHDMTFDNSIQDIFVAWENGACVCVAKNKDKLLPVSFIQKNEITVWFSVPSVAAIIDKYGRLLPDTFPSLRYSFFAGEALYSNIATKWQEAAKNTKLINTYGPTETTVTITYYDWESQESPDKCVDGVVPLGKVYEGNFVRLIGPDGRTVEVNQPGEMCLSGLQVTREYWKNSEQTKKQYVTFSDTGNTIWYKSGDLARLGEDGLLYYLGRIDNQVQIQGNRVELGAIDQVLKEASGVQLAVSIPLLISPGNAENIIAFICSRDKANEGNILNYCRSKLPKYMVPSKVHFIDDMPLNVNGKIDRIQLQKYSKGGK